MAVINFLDVLTIQPDFFDNIDIDERINRKTLAYSILRRCGTLQPIYTDTTIFKCFSDNFFYERATTIKKLLDTTEFEYNPIENYDRKQDITRDENITAGIGHTVITTPNTTQTVTGSATGNSENKVSAYDAEEYQPKEKTEAKNAEETTTINTGTVQTTTTQNGTDKTRETTTLHSHGNIGVTTTQSLIKQEREIALFNIYNWISCEFEQNFFICVS